MDKARMLSEIFSDVIDIRKALRRKGIAEETLDSIWNLVNEAFRRGCEYVGEEYDTGPHSR